MALVAVNYSLRAPEWAATPHADLYPACLEQCVWAEQHGLSLIALNEHHGIPDGWTPAPLTLAAAIAARTSSIRIFVSALLLPLHDPIRLAEQIAVVDLIARGRVGIVAGAGYVPHEFAMAGVDRSKRGKILEEWIEVARRAWTGEEFEWRGRTIRVTPRPATRPHPLILVGGSSEAAARRAARLRLGFFPSTGDPRLGEVYREEAARQGFDTPFYMAQSAVSFVFVAEDPEKMWSEIGRYVWHEAETYASWQTPGTISDVASKAKDLDELRREGIYRVLTPDECVAYAEELGPAGTIVLHPLLCGIPLDLSWESLELFGAKVLPRIQG